MPNLTLNDEWRDKPRVRYVPSRGTFEFRWNGWQFATIDAASPYDAWRLLCQAMQQARIYARRINAAVPNWALLQVT